MAVKEPDVPPLRGLNENDAEKVKVLLRSFATAEDLAEFIKSARDLRRESERRAWAWDVIKKTAAGITLISGALTILWNAYLSWKGGGP